MPHDNVETGPSRFDGPSGEGCDPWHVNSRGPSSSTSGTRVADWDAFLPDQGARGRAERARRALRRHRHGGVVALRRPDQHADDGPARGGRPDLLAVAHDRALLADAVDVPHRPQPPPERLRDDLGVVDRVPRLQLAHPAVERHHGQRAARRRLGDVLGRQEPQRADRRVDRGRARRRTGRSAQGYDRFYGFIGGETNNWYPVARRGQPLHRPAVHARGRLPPVEGPRRPGAAR